MKRFGRLVIFLLVLAVIAGAALVIVPGQIAPQLAKRLSDETGLSWRIGSAHLSTDGGLALTDVAADAAASREGPLLSIKTLTLIAPWHMLFGSAGTVQTRAVGLVVRAPTEVGDAKAMKTEALSRLSDLTATMRGVTGALAGDKKTLILAADQIAASFIIAETPVRDRKIVVSGETSGGTLRVEARQANPGTDLLADADVTLTREPRGRDGLRLTATTKFRVDGKRVRLADIRGMLDGGAFNGVASIDTGATPSPITWDVRFDRVALVDDLHGAASTTASTAATPTIRTSMLQDVDLSWLDRVTLDGKVRVEDAQLTKARAGGVEATIGGKPGSLDVAMVAARFYDGVLRARYVLGRDGGETKHQTVLSIARARALPLLVDAIGVKGLDGQTNVTFNAQSRGDRIDDVLRNATGSGDVAVTDGSLNGLDLAGTVGIGGGGLAQSAAGLLSSKFNRLTGTFRIEGGQAITNDLRFDMPVIETTGTGVIDFIGETIDFRLLPKLGGGNRQNRMTIPVRIAGPWGSPGVSTDLNGVLANPGAALQTLQDLGGALSKGGGGGGGLGGILDQIMPRGGGAPGRR